METVARAGLLDVVPGIVPAPADLLRDLREAHEMVREAIELKLEVAATPEFTVTHCALVRWKMSRCRHRRNKSLTAAVTELLRHASPAEAAVLRRLQLEELNLSRCCAAHLQRWTADAIARSREDYAYAATRFCGEISERLRLESEILYPMLLDRAAARPYASKELAKREA